MDEQTAEERHENQPGPPWVIFVCEKCSFAQKQGWGSGYYCTNPACENEYGPVAPVEVVPATDRDNKKARLR
jgi:hypothetical protein